MKLINMEANRNLTALPPWMDRGRDTFASSVALIIELARDSSPRGSAKVVTSISIMPS